jgi:anti-anti-sigma factor
MNEHFGLQISREGPQATIAVWGELDLDTSPELRDAFDTALATPSDTLTLDLSDLSFCDSSGVHALLQIIASTIEQQVTLRLVRPVAASVLAIFERTDLLHRYSWIKPEADDAS